MPDGTLAAPACFPSLPHLRFLPFVLLFPLSKLSLLCLLSSSPRDVLAEVKGSAPFIGPHGLLYPPSGGGVDGDGELVVVWYGVVVVVVAIT